MPNGTGGILRHRDPASRCLSFLPKLTQLPPPFAADEQVNGDFQGQFSSRLVLHAEFLYPAFVTFCCRSLLLCSIALLTACTSTSEDKDSKEESDSSKNNPVAVGIIEFVNPEQKFVLIKMHTRQPMPIGQSLTALDATGALTKLTISPERKGTHVTADIKSGNPRPGNLVIFQPDATTPVSIPSPTVNPTLPSVTSPGAVEWRDGQPPPILTPNADSLPPLPSVNPSAPLPTIPLEPLPEEPPSSKAP